MWVSYIECVQEEFLLTEPVWWVSHFLDWSWRRSRTGQQTLADVTVPSSKARPLESHFPWANSKSTIYDSPESLQKKQKFKKTNNCFNCHAEQVWTGRRSHRNQKKSWEKKNTTVCSVNQQQGQKSQTRDWGLFTSATYFTFRLDKRTESVCDLWWSRTTQALKWQAVNQSVSFEEHRKRLFMQGHSRCQRAPQRLVAQHLLIFACFSFNNKLIINKQ